jgi:hypothetical protein
MEYDVKVGDLVQERLPLMAGDAPERLGIITSLPTARGFCKVLFDKEELVHYNEIRKMEA